MKSPKSPPVASKAKQLPKPFVSPGHYLTHPDLGTSYKLTMYFPSASSARARLRWEKLSEEEKVEAIASIVTIIDSPHDIARAIIRLISGGKSK